MGPPLWNHPCLSLAPLPASFMEHALGVVHLAARAGESLQMFYHAEKSECMLMQTK